jgi:hypothetical protein
VYSCVRSSNINSGNNRSFEDINIHTAVEGAFNAVVSKSDFEKRIAAIYHASGNTMSKTEGDLRRKYLNGEP